MSLKENLKIMIVDDMSTSRGILMNTLYEIGIKQVEFSKDGKEALNKIAGNPAHLIISDYNMPEMDGLQLLKAVRENKMTSKVGFILVTGTESAEVVKEGMALGMNNYLKKPFNAESMKKCISQVVGALD